MKNICSAISVLAISFVIAVTTSAATFNVTTTNDTLDSNPGDGICADAGVACSLRAAIGEANALAGADTILLVPGIYTQTLVAANEDANAGGDWDVTSEITIRGTGEFSSALEAATSPGTGTERVINVLPSGDLTLIRVMVRNGRFSGAMTASTRGAGIENNGILTLDNVIVRDNQITANSGDPMGAGIHNGGTAMTLIRTAVTANSNTRQSGGSAFGGGISSVGVSTLTFTNSVVEGNSVFATGGFAIGGGIYLEGLFTANMVSSLVSNNLGGGTSGVNGSGVTAISNTGAAVFNATGCTFRNNSGAGSAGGQGVGLYFLTTGTAATALTATLDRVSVKDNIGTSSGVGIGATLNGGNMTLNISSSSITNNIGGVVGGGIFVTDAGPPPAAGSRATVNVTNTTISSNTANGTGGGLALQGSLTGANLNYVTIAGNTADSCGGICSAGGTVNIKNSIVGDNAGGTTPDIGGEIVSGDYNHIESLSGATIIGTTTNNATGDALLGPLVEHVGGTVHMPGANSPVLNTIPNGNNGCGTTVTVDQRGVTRGQGGGCDKGSVERAVSATIGGKVTTFEGRGIRNAIVTLTSSSLPQPLIAQTGSMGWYAFPNLPAEQTYTLRVTAKRFEFTFEFQGVYLTADRLNLDFKADPGFGVRPAEK